MDSSRSLPSTGRSSRGTSRLVGVDGSNNVGRKLRKLKSFEKSSGNELDGVQVLELSDDSVAKKRCAWVTPNSGLRREYHVVYGIFNLYHNANDD